MHQRINITLPEQTIRVIDRMAGRGQRSRLIDLAVRHYVAKAGRASLKQRLKEGAIRRAQRDLAVVEDWFSLEEEAWPGSRS